MKGIKEELARNLKINCLKMELTQEKLAENALKVCRKLLSSI
jgi:hypothetical protein